MCASMPSPLFVFVCPGVFVVETTVLENSVCFLIGCTSNGHQAELSLANGPEIRHMRQVFVTMALSTPIQYIQPDSSNTLRYWQWMCPRVR
jgi:hypothetical protein